MKRKKIVVDLKKVPNKSISSGLMERVEESCKASGEEMLGHLLEIRPSINESFLEMGGLFREIKYKKLYLEFGYENWTTFIKDKFGYDGRKVNYLIQTYEYFFFEIDDEETIQKISQLGRVKAHKLVHIVNSKNVHKWVELCKDATVKEVSQKVSQFWAKRMVSFKMRGNQSDDLMLALNVAEKISGSYDMSDNLSMIALEYRYQNYALIMKSPVEKKKWVDLALLTLEQKLGLKLVAIDKVTDMIIYGSEHITEEKQELAKQELNWFERTRFWASNLRSGLFFLKYSSR